MENFSADVLYSIAIYLDLPEILKLCATNKEINKKLCKRDSIWIYKLNQVSDQESVKNLKEQTKLDSFKGLYKLVYILNKVIDAFKLKETIYELYDLQELWLQNNQISEILKELGNL